MYLSIGYLGAFVQAGPALLSKGANFVFCLFAREANFRALPLGR